MPQPISKGTLLIGGVIGAMVCLVFAWILFDMMNTPWTVFRFVATSCMASVGFVLGMLPEWKAHKHASDTFAISKNMAALDRVLEQESKESPQSRLHSAHGEPDIDDTA